MATEAIEVFVVRRGSGWTILLDGLARGRFDYKVDAEEAAIRLAQGAQGHEGPSGVMSPDHGSQMRWLWRSFPPPVAIAAAQEAQARTPDAFLEASRASSNAAGRRARPVLCGRSSTVFVGSPGPSTAVSDLT